jgi:tetraacyldisaccharide 4'-kinase
MERIPPALAPVLWMPGLAWEALVRARNGLYNAGLLKRRRLPNPVISVGNLTLGGTGKTPLVIHAAGILSSLGYTPAVLTRGYRRDRPGQPRILPPGRGDDGDASLLGDEPALIRRRVPSAWMGVSADRYGAGRLIARHAPDAVFLLDDGFQHRALHRDLDIVVLDASRPLGSDRVFPRGTLREPPHALRRCHAVVLNEAPEETAAAAVEEEIRRLRCKAMVFHCRQRIRALVPFASWSRAAGDGDPVSAVRSAYLAAAIGNPARFRLDVGILGIEVRGARFFPDHHRIGRREWTLCAEEARKKGADAILVTEKDAVKITEPPDFPLLVSVQSSEIREAGAYEAALKACAEGRR